jgi:hypothetical protein
VIDCVGLWRRTLLVDTDGSHDTGTDVLWLQGISAYVDTRGFAGRLQQRGDVFEWSRFVDTQPPGPFPDTGRMHWETDTLVEVGVHTDYVEHWVRDDRPTSPCWALVLTDAILLRVGDTYGWADSEGAVLGDVDGPGWAAMRQRLGRRDVVESEGEVQL